MWWNEIAGLFSEQFYKLAGFLLGGAVWLGNVFRKWWQKKKDEEAALVNRITDLETEVKGMDSKLSNLSNSFEDEKVYRRDQDKEVKEMFSKINDRLIIISNDTAKNTGRLEDR